MVLEQKIIINEHIISEEHPCYIIAEIGINHNGNIKLAKKLIDVAITAGANAVKFQKRDLKSLYKEEIIKNPNIDSQGLEILLDVLKKVEFGKEEYKEIIDYCKNRKITFLCTPWDKQSVDFLEEFNVPAYKIASADMTNFPLLKYLCVTKKPLIVSTGMSTLDEIDRTVKFLKMQNAKFILLHTNSTYPAPTESLNLKLISFLKNRFNVLIGYSGHEKGIVPSLTAANLGSVIIERHITLDKAMEGLDQAASLEPKEFTELVSSIRESELAKGKMIKKMSRGEILQREVLGKSIICSMNIKKGETISNGNIEVKGPAKGISPQYYYELIGTKATRDFKKGEYFLENDK